MKSADDKILKKGFNLIHKLGMAPPNVLTPHALACHFDNIRAADRELMGILTVGGEAGRLGHTEINPEAKGPRIAIIGKGVTFDSGGISIKPAKNMGDMKFDMLGCATALALGDTLKGVDCPIDIYGCIAENCFRPDMARPGDVITYSDGTKVEIVNTDAEGRLVLADGILQAKNKNPAVIITIATLTGAAAGALGEGVAVFSNDDTLAEYFLIQAVESVERAWRLPIWPEHKKNIKAKKEVAHLKNCGTIAGASTAAAFLDHFLGETPYLHLDIAGAAYKNEEPTGTMLKTLTDFFSVDGNFENYRRIKQLG